jgi:hypothetical protein
MNRWCIIACFLLSACKKDEQPELLLQAHFIAGKPLVDVRLFWVDQEQLRPVDHRSSVSIALIREDGQEQMLQLIDGVYRTVGPAILENTVYRLQARVEDKEMSAQIKVPSRPVLSQSSTPVFSAQPSVPFDVIFA